MSIIDDKQDAALEAVQQRLPEVNTARGADQRWRVHIPSPATQLVLGARGQNPPIGPRGVGLYTQYNFGCEVHQNTCFHSLENLIAHSGWETGLFAERGFVLSTNQALRVGTVGDVEITAGEAGFADTNYTVLSPASDVPFIDDFRVDAAGPRAQAEGAYGGLATAGQIWAVISAFRGFSGSVQRASASSAWPKGQALEGLVRTAIGTGEALVSLATAVAQGLDIIDEPDSHAPALKAHSVGDMKLMSRSKASLFAIQGVSIGSMKKVSVKAIYSVGMKSAGVAKVWGGVGAALKSEGFTGVAGKLLDLKGKAVAFLHGEKLLAMSSATAVTIESKGIELTADEGATLTSGKEMDITGRDALKLHSDHKVVVRSRDTMAVQARHALDIESESGSVKVHVGDNQLMIDSSHVQLKQGGAGLLLEGGEAILKSGSTRLKVDASAVTINGRQIRLG